MTEVTDRISRRQVDKFAERRAQLATSALRTLSELGYARTSLREIAQNSDFSHGVLHYYFRDKVELITHCVQHYKAECVTRYDQIVVTATTAEGLRTDFAEALADHLPRRRHDAPALVRPAQPGAVRGVVPRGRPGDRPDASN